MKLRLSLRVIALSLFIWTLQPAATMAEEDYAKPYRPQFHFTPAKNWMNDPNGMVFYDGEYHLFYQYNPFGNKWGHMSWGHAVSKDLVHWEHLPVAIPEANNVMIFSGSAVVDWKNTSGFGKNGKPPLVAIYTGHHTNQKRQDQRIAYSNDRGRTWTNYAENPVLDLRMSDFRDPKVMWHEETAQWIMTVSIPLERKIAFYGSPDLKHWRPLSEFGPAGSVTGIYECPDLFPLPVEGSKEKKWVLVVNVGGGAPAGGSGCQYFVGEFNGKTFVADKRTHPQLTSSVALPEGEVYADFEGGYPEGWMRYGEAVGKQPAKGSLPGQLKVDGYLGESLFNSFNNGDKSKGGLRSLPFRISKNRINFLIGGGAHKGKTCMNLLVKRDKAVEQVVRTETGSESEHLSWKSWDVSEFKGQLAHLEIVDEETGGWGHISVDHIMFSDQAAKEMPATTLWADHGQDFYAAVSWSDIPANDGRRIWMGWMSNWQYAQDVPTSPWRSAMTVPRTLSLRKTADGYRLVQSPVKELDKLHASTEVFAGGTLQEANQWLKTRKGQLLDVEFEFDNAKGTFAIQIAGAEKSLTEVKVSGPTISLDRRRSGRVDFHAKFPGHHVAPMRQNEDGAVSVRLLIDTSSIEAFGNGGESVISDLIFPKAGDHRISLTTAGGVDPPSLKSIRFSKLKSAWATRTNSRTPQTR